MEGDRDLEEEEEDDDEDEEEDDDEDEPREDFRAFGRPRSCDLRGGEFMICKQTNNFIVESIKTKIEQTGGESSN